MGGPKINRSRGWKNISFVGLGRKWQAMASADRPLEFTILMPCLNEAKTIARCVTKARQSLDRLGIEGEVLVADNGSTDGSQKLADQAGARVIHVATRGYGAALRGGIEAAQGRYIIMGDADDSYDFLALEPFVKKLREGYDLVMGDRFRGGIEPGAMPPLHRYFGNPALSFIGRLFFRTRIGDFYCGLRGFSKEAAERMNLRTTGMEFAVEVVVKAALHRMRITQVPTTLSPDGRGRPPHLRSWRDGWRGLRFMLMFSPRWLFLYPGMVVLLGGLTLGAILLATGVPRSNSLLFAMAMTMMGLQSVWFALIVRIFAIRQGFLPGKPELERFSRILNLEVGVAVGAILLLLGFVGYGCATTYWIAHDFGAFPDSLTRFMVIPSTFLLIVGVQTILNSFVLSILGLEYTPGKLRTPFGEQGQR